MAAEALVFHIEGLIGDGEAIPDASNLGEIMADRDNRKAVAILVPIKTDAPGPIRY